MKNDAKIWRKLIGNKFKAFSHGEVFRLSAVRPHEPVVEFILADLISHKLGRFGLVVATGRQAGRRQALLPKEAECGPGTVGIQSRWLAEHWQQAVYPHCAAKDVRWRRQYEADDADKADPAGWTRLLEHGGATLPVGSVLRHPARWPYEDEVDVMVIDWPSKERRFALLVSTGYKAGLLRLQVPQPAEAPGGAGLSTRWVIENWAKWIYTDCAVGDVLVRPCYTIWP